MTVRIGSDERRRRAFPRSEKGAALAEFALVLPLLAILVFGTIDLGRVFRLSTRLENAAREGATGIAAFSPFRVDSGCRGHANVVDRVKDEDTALGAEPGFAVKVFKRDSGTGALVPPGGITGCDATTPGVTVAPGDRIVVQVEAVFDALSPVTGRGRITVHGSHEVVLQG